MVLTKKGNFVDLSSDKKKLFEEFLEFLENKKNLSEVNIPISIFDNTELSALEAIVKYLKENVEFNFHEIAEKLNRDDRTIWSTYKNSQKKLLKNFIISDSKYFIPISQFTNRKLGVLESICIYLKESYGLTFHQIAVLLNRNDRTIWSSYNKAKGKIGK